MQRKWTILSFLLLLYTGSVAYKPPAMDNHSFQQTVAALIKDLQYSSESDFPLELLSTGASHTGEFPAGLNADKEATMESVDADSFFDHYIKAQEMSGDPVMIQAADRYKKLKDFLKASSTSLTVWRSGGTRKDIYIVFNAKDGKGYAIKTTAIET